MIMTLAAVLTAGLLSQSSQPQPTPSNAGLRIVVIAGEDAVNIIQQKTAVAPIVEVRDRNNQPVAGAIVTFTITGQNASFGGASTLSLTTNAAGRAAVATMSPTGTGAVQINVAAAFQGQTATATIAQTNLVTAAQAASAGGSASGGGGGIGAGTITAIGAGVAAAGAAVALSGKQEEDTGPVTLIQSLEARPPIAAQATPVFMDARGLEQGVTFTWDFGDGARTTSTDLQPTYHTYLSAGTFTVTLSVTDPGGRTETKQTSVTIRSLSGRWAIDVGGFLDFIQSGTALTGAYTAVSTQASGTLTGTVGPGEVPGFQNFAPGVGFTITANNRQQFRFEGSVVETSAANAITGGIGTTSGIVTWRLTRQ